MAAVGCWLEAIGLSSYADRFDELGYDDLAFLAQMGGEELRQVAVEVEMRPGHRDKFASWFGDVARRW